MVVSPDSKDGYILTSIQNYFRGVGKVYKSLPPKNGTGELNY
jgi:hypothetical protein